MFCAFRCPKGASIEIFVAHEWEIKTTTPCQDEVTGRAHSECLFDLNIGGLRKV
jgi:hypothetical protein